MTEKPEQEPVPASSPSGKKRRWPQVRRFLVFQIKLYVDAFRDFFLSLLSFPAFIMDLIEGKEGEDSHMESILKLGRRSEKAINLFEQHSREEQDGHSVDSIIDHVEQKIKTESLNK